VPDVGRDGGARQVRVIHAVADEPGPVLRVHDFASRDSPDSTVH
jgi:hypothetical protein